MSDKPAFPTFAPLGDSAMIVTLGDSLDRALNRQVHRCAAAVRDAALPGVEDVVAAYASFAVHYDARATDETAMAAHLRVIMAAVTGAGSSAEDGRLITIGVRYDGPDLAAVAEATGLTEDAVVQRHAAVEYDVYMLGFAPGFAYLGEIDPVLRLPRRETPRTRVPPGSVAIAGSQTAVYPHETPGGWHLLGHTDVEMFDVEREQPSLLRPGDRVRFEPVT